MCYHADTSLQPEIYWICEQITYLVCCVAFYKRGMEAVLRLDGERCRKQVRAGNRRGENAVVAVVSATLVDLHGIEHDCLILGAVFEVSRKGSHKSWRTQLLSHAT